MKRRDFDKDLYRLMDLHLFDDPDPDPDGGGDPDPDPDGGGDPDPDGGGEPKPKYTDEDVQKMVDKAIAKTLKKKQKEIDEAKKLAAMSAEEKKAHEIEELKSELADLKAANAKSEMIKVARSILQEQGISASDSIIERLVGEDAESTKSAVESYIEIYKADVAKAVKDKYKGESPKRGGKHDTMTREDILKVKNRAERQRLINEHKDLFGI